MIKSSKSFVRDGAIRVKSTWGKLTKWRFKRLYDNRGLNLLAWFAVILAAPYLVLLVTVFWGLWEIIIRFPAALTDEVGELRWHVLALVGLMTALAGLAGTPLALIRVFTTERQTKTQEESHVTEQINEAVASLAAQKEVNRLGRTLCYVEDRETKSIFEWQDSPFELPKEAKEDTDKSTPWTNVTVTEPNIEVRIGAILSLERLARQRAEAARGKTKRTEDNILDHDGARDHVRIMEILCAYVRENAKADDAAPFEAKSQKDFNDFHSNERQEINSFEENSFSSKGMTYTHQKYMPREIARLKKPRTDLQIALRVLGRRTKDQIRSEGQLRRESQAAGDVWDGFRIDLRGANLRRMHLSHRSSSPMNLRFARLDGALLEGANLENAMLDGTNLAYSSFRGARLKNASLEKANLADAQFQGVDLIGAHLREAKLYCTQLQGSFLEGTDLKLTGWTFANATASLVSHADLRAVRGLMQNQLAGLVGNAATLLPGVFSDGQEPMLYDRWETEPRSFVTLVENLGQFELMERDIRAIYLCEDGRRPRRVGIPLALDADPPWGPHSSNSQEAREWVQQQEKTGS